MRLPRTPRGNSRYNGWILCRRPRIDTRCCSSYSFRVVEEVLHLLKKKPAWFHHRKKISKYPSFFDCSRRHFIVIFSIIVIAMRQRHSALMILRRSECGWIFRDKISRKILQQLDAEKNGQHAKPEEVRRLWSLVFPLLLRWGRWMRGWRHRLVTVSKEKCY